MRGMAKPFLWTGLQPLNHLSNPIFGGFVHAFRNKSVQSQEKISNSHENANQPGLDHDFSRGLIDMLISRYRIFESCLTRQWNRWSSTWSGKKSERVALTEYAGGDRSEIKITKPLQTGLSVQPCR